jgi:hypothetical protein
MSEVKHTPGPWIITQESYGTVIRGAEVVRESDGYEYPFREYVASTWGERSDTTDADARLIAAAPEMLDALRRASMALAWASDREPVLIDDYNAVNDIIARATGSQQ